MAIKPVLIHPRLVTQKAGFTVHGDDQRPMEEILQQREMSKVLKKFVMKPASVIQITQELKILGLSHANIFTDLDGIAKDIVQKQERFFSYEP